MPKQVQKSGLLSKLNSKTKGSFDKAKSAEVKLPQGGGEVPAGVSGVAKLKSLKFDTYKSGENKGKLYFSGVGICVSGNPDKVNGVKVAGLRTQCRVDIFDTPNRKVKTEQEHLEEVINYFKLLGGKECVEALDDVGGLEDLANELVEMGIHFNFRTWKMNKRKKGEPNYNEKYDGPNAPEPRTNHTWAEAVDYEAEESGDEVEDETDKEEEVEDSKNETEVSDDNNGENTDDSETEASDEDDGLDELIALIQGKDKVKAAKAEKEFLAKALEAGISKEDVKNAESWEDAVEMVRNPKEEGEEDGEEDESEGDGEEESEEEENEEEVQTPAVDEIYSYKPEGSKTKIKVKVTFVSTKTESVKVLDVKTKKPLLGKDKKPLMIPFDELIVE